jgi:hypothetical protein
MLEVSCCCTLEFLPLDDPTVSPGFAVGPLLLPSWPAIPVPEFCAGRSGCAGLRGLSERSRPGQGKRNRETADDQLHGVSSDREVQM